MTIWVWIIVIAAIICISVLLLALSEMREHIAYLQYTVHVAHKKLFTADCEIADLKTELNQKKMQEYLKCADEMQRRNRCLNSH